MGWWNKDLTDLRARFRVISRRRNRTDRAQLYKEARNEYSRVIKAAKHQGWKDLVSKAESVKSVQIL